MPLYEYECEACGHRFERILKFSDPPVETCPSCGGRVHKLISSPAFQFKGTGWYITDYAKKDGGAGKSGSGGDESASSSKDKNPSSKESGDGKASKDAPATKAETPASSGSPATPSTSAKD